MRDEYRCLLILGATAIILIPAFVALWVIYQTQAATY